MCLAGWCWLADTGKQVFESHRWLAKNHIASYESMMASILADVIAKQILRELGVNKVGSSKIFSSHSPLLLWLLGCLAGCLQCSQ